MNLPRFELVNNRTGERKPYPLRALAIDFFLCMPLMLSLLIIRPFLPKDNVWRKERFWHLPVRYTRSAYLTSILMWVYIIWGLVVVIAFTPSK